MRQTPVSMREVRALAKKHGLKPTRKGLRELRSTIEAMRRGLPPPQLGNREHTLLQQQWVAENALKDIEKWSMEMMRTDPLYRRKEDALMPAVQRILRETPPGGWLRTLQRLYASIRPRPMTMIEAINAGMGYDLQPFRTAKTGKKAPRETKRRK